MKPEDIKIGDQIVLSDRKHPLIVTKIVEPSDDPLSEFDDKVAVNIKGGDNSYTSISFGLEGPQGGEYTMIHVSEDGEAAISPAPYRIGKSMKKSSKRVEIEDIIPSED